jgi:hypothetical protein
VRPGERVPLVDDLLEGLGQGVAPPRGGSGGQPDPNQLLDYLLAP